MTKVLLDTHALIWWLEGGGKLSTEARRVIVDPDATVLVSSASAWEIAIKQHAGKFRVRDLIRGTFKEEFSKKVSLNYPSRLNMPSGPELFRENTKIRSIGC